MFRKLILAAAAFGLVLVAGTATAAPHHSHHVTARRAASGVFTYSEWANVSEGQSQANVEGINTCGCTGVVVSTWTNGGVQHKTVAYPDAAGDAAGTGGAFLNYALQDGTWRTNNWIEWAEAGESTGLEFKYDDGVGNAQVGIIGR